MCRLFCFGLHTFSLTKGSCGSMRVMRSGTESQNE